MNEMLDLKPAFICREESDKFKYLIMSSNYPQTQRKGTVTYQNLTVKLSEVVKEHHFYKYNSFMNSGWCDVTLLIQTNENIQKTGFIMKPSCLKLLGLVKSPDNTRPQKSAALACEAEVSSLCLLHRVAPLFCDHSGGRNN